MGRTQAFIELFKPVYDAYEAQKVSMREMDFNDMRDNNSFQFHHRYDYVLVDEFGIFRWTRQVVKSITGKPG